MRADIRIKNILKFIECVRETFEESEKDGKLAEDLFDYIESIKFSLEDILSECNFDEYIIIPVEKGTLVKIAHEGDTIYKFSEEDYLDLIKKVTAINTNEQVLVVRK